MAAVPRLSLTVAIFLLSTIATARTYSVPYEGIHLTFPTAPRLIYTTSDSNPALVGYSYTTRNLNGDGSNVVFATGANSVSRLRDEMNSLYGTRTRTPERYSQKELSDKTYGDLMSSYKQQYDTKDASVNKQDDLRNHFDSNLKLSNEEMKQSRNPEMDNSFIEHQALSQRVFLVRVPYPTFRSNLLSSPLPEDRVSNEIQSQYYPHNSYARLELPLRNPDFYGTAIPLLYQASIRVPASGLKRLEAATVVENTKASMERDTTESTQNNANLPKTSSTPSDIIESKSNLRSMTAGEILSKTNATNKSGSMTESKEAKVEVTSGEIVSATIKPESSNDQIIESKVSSTELASTDVSPCMKESNITTSTISTVEK